MTPGRKFSTTTSVVATRRCTISTASGRFRSRITLFLPVLSSPNELLAPLRSGGRDRIMSPPSGASSLITSAPTSANSRVQCGPAIVVVKSTTRTPFKGLFIRLPGCHCERSEAISLPLRLLPKRLLRRYAPRNDNGLSGTRHGNPGRDAAAAHRAGHDRQRAAPQRDEPGHAGRSG